MPVVGDLGALPPVCDRITLQDSYAVHVLHVLGHVECMDGVVERPEALQLGGASLGGWYNSSCATASSLALPFRTGKFDSALWHGVLGCNADFG